MHSFGRNRMTPSAASGDQNIHAERGKVTDLDTPQSATLKFSLIGQKSRSPSKSPSGHARINTLILRCKYSFHPIVRPLPLGYKEDTGSSFRVPESRGGDDF
jgi:hypothetical protein